MKIVHVEWIDSHAPLDRGWHSIEDIQNTDDTCICYSVGYCLSSTDIWLTLLQTINSDSTEAFHPFKIPTKAIISLKELT